MDTEKAIQSKMKELTEMTESRLKELLAEKGLDKIPLTGNSKSLLLKQLAKRILDMDTHKSEDDSGAEATESNNNTDAEELRKNLQEARDSLSFCLNDSFKTHYVICIPGIVNSITVHSDFQEVLKIMKEHKSQNPRMLSFRSLAEAETFAANHAANEVCEGATIKSSYPQEKAEVEGGEIKLFPSLSTPQINEFRIQLEKCNIPFCREKINANPRFLIGNGDMPTILKEGTRYNAMHASVISGHLESCQLIMEMVSDVEFLKRMYGTQSRAEENSTRLIDLYLNTPDKIANKTPLHFASEKGMVDIVAFLVSFKACIRNFNKHIVVTVKKGDKHYESRTCTGKTPEEVACSRYNGPSPATTKAKIINLIQDGTCYVPLIRSDTSAPYAKVGDPYTPTSPYKLVSEIEDAFYPTTIDTDASLRDLRNMKVWAFAGPMSPQEAEDFKREWKSPRMKRHDRSHRDNLKIVDGDRGFERFGRELADVHSTSWQEYWPFLDAFADLRSEKGLEKLENFFQKQRTVISMQTFLKSRTDFVEARPYQVGQQFILKQSADSKLDDSGGENNTAYVSAESSNETEEKWDGPEVSSHDVCKQVQPNKLGKDFDSQVKSSGMFSSLWNGFSRIKNYLSPRSNPTQHHAKNTQSGAAEEVVPACTRQEASQTTTASAVPKSDDIKSGESRSGESSSGDECLTLNLPKDTANQQTNNNGVNNVPDSSVASQTEPDSLTSNSGEPRSDETKSGEPKSSEPKSGYECITPILPKDSAIQPTNITGAKNVPETNVAIQTDPDSLTSDSKILNSSDTKSSDSLLMSSKILDIDSQSSSVTWEPATGRSLIFSSQSHLDISRSPRHWKYRSSKHSIESPEKSPDKDFRSSSPSSGRRHPGKKSRSDTHHNSSGEGALASSSKPEAKQSDSFNSKMDSICKNLEKFSILSPERSSSLSFEFSSDLEDFDLVLDPNIHIFTGKMFAKFTAQLTSYKSSSPSSEGADLLPIVSLRQDQDEEAILADVFLPEATLCSSLVQLKGPVMDEPTHKEVVKNVWVNFLVVFPLSEDAHKICSLAKDEVMTAVIEGLPEDKDTFGGSKNLRSDSKSLKELFFHCQSSIEENAESLTTKIRVLRSETVPKKDVFVCGSIPTKMDADVYNTLNAQSCQLICNQSFRFPLCKQWLDRMDKPGREFINNLPTPSRILRQERWELPPFSPLVTSSTPSSTGSRPPLPNLTSTPKTTKESLRENPVVKNLFASEFKADE